MGHDGEEKTQDRIFRPGYTGVNDRIGKQRHLGYSLAVGGVDKVATGFVERVEQLEAALLVHGAHTQVRPLVADAHGSELDGRNMNAGTRGKGSVAAELGLGRRRWYERHV